MAKHKKIKLLSGYNNSETIQELSNNITRYIFTKRNIIIGPEFSTMKPYFNSTLEVVHSILKNLIAQEEVEFRLPNGVYYDIPKERINEFEESIIKKISEKMSVKIEIL